MISALPASARQQRVAASPLVLAKLEDELRSHAVESIAWSGSAAHIANSARRLYAGRMRHSGV